MIATLQKALGREMDPRVGDSVLVINLLIIRQVTLDDRYAIFTHNNIILPKDRVVATIETLARSKIVFCKKVPRITKLESYILSWVALLV